MMVFDRAPKAEYDGMPSNFIEQARISFINLSLLAWASLGNPGWDWNGRSPRSIRFEDAT